MSRDISERVWTLAHTAAREVRRQFPIVPFEDLRSEAVLWAVANPKKTAEYEDHEDTRQGDRLIYSSMRNRLRVYGQKETASAYGYTGRSDMYAHYSAGQLREELLPCLWDKDLWANPPSTGRPETKSNSDPAHGNTWVAQLADVADAWRRLSAYDRALVEDRFRYDIPQTRMAKSRGVSDQTISDHVEYAVQRMLASLGGERPIHQADEIPVGSRRALSNAHAQAMNRTGYEGE